MKGKKNKKELALKIIFIISVIPYIYTIFWAIINSILGFEFGFFGNYKKYVGIDAFVLFIQLAIYSWAIVYIPCLIYQLFYLTRHLIKKHKSKTTNVNENIEK